MNTAETHMKDSATFAQVMGNAVWLMTMSKAHRDLPIRVVEDLISPAILIKQFRLFSKDKQPVAFLIWASVSDEVKAKIDAGGYTLHLSDWRSGPHVVVLDCISPFNPREQFEKQFQSSLAAAQVAASISS